MKIAGPVGRKGRQNPSGYELGKGYLILQESGNLYMLFYISLLADRLFSGRKSQKPFFLGSYGFNLTPYIRQSPIMTTPSTQKPKPKTLFQTPQFLTKLAKTVCFLTPQLPEPAGLKDYCRRFGLH